jgi:hypothetical protein
VEKAFDRKVDARKEAQAFDQKSKKSEFGSEKSIGQIFLSGEGRKV